jgi:uncharacterized damage-inducible protein DinB
VIDNPGSDQPRSSLAYLASRWQAVRSGTLATVEKFADAELDFRPFPSSRTVREIMLHLAQEERGELGLGITQTLTEFPSAYDPAEYPTVEAIKALFDAVHATTIDYLATLRDDDLRRVVETPWGASYPLIELLDHIVDHEIHHRAELSLILGMLGRTGYDA